MIKSDDGLRNGLSERPPKFNLQEQKNDNTSLPDQSTIITKPGEEIAYLSAPANWSDEIHSHVLQRVRSDIPNLRVESYRTAFTLSELLADSPTWPELFQNFIASASTLIVACDSTRIVGVGIRREIDMALRSKKRIILFDVTEGCRRRYFGFDLIENGSIKLRRGLRTKSEREALERSRKKRLKKRERDQVRLARRLAERGATDDNTQP